MNNFKYLNQELFAENVSVTQLAKQFGTPLYIYSKNYIEQQWLAFDQALAGRKHLVCYAMKANSNLAVLNILAKLGAGFDIVSQGELERVLAAGGDAGKVVFSGVAKTEAEIARALEVGVRCFNVESIPELYRINEVAKRLNKKAPVSLRINPDVDAKTHPYISTGMKENKFGISYEIALEVYKEASRLSHLSVEGIDCHIGSQLTELTPFLDAADRVLALVDSLEKEGIHIHHLDFGGGLGVCYNDEVPPTPAEFVKAILKKVENYPHLEILFEPGRAIVANAGLLVTHIEYLKHHEDNHFAIVDAGMNDLIRPALYESWMKIIPVSQKTNQAQSYVYNVVGPVCESSDFLGKQRELAVEAGDYLAVCSAGAYGFGMASNYNSRPKPAEIMVDGNKAYVIRQREKYTDLWAGEQLIG
ncbi:diaminopimelate decarboxylase [Zophobihabitans entericus]|uniref:Diaminopimelate decarboxylase n=1 Tax=Zophobihabitans entericus TaxID=1635327 RepID=A0A6G9IAN0_9GAMM|nr:diaminopimelate decarboxylase [Zophobihabitans entericus]QIQ21281.1 diaminopimelate decarboxylase [Zophobihabitans entericus]